MSFGELTCDWVLEHVDDYIDDDGALSAAQRDAVDRHAAHCAACQDEIRAARAVVQTLRGIPQVPVPASVIDAAERAIQPAVCVVPMVAPRPRAIRWVPSIVAAAALVAVIATAQWTPRTPPEPLASEAQVEAAARETLLALSYVNHSARRTGDILTREVLNGTLPPIRRAMEKSGIVETKSPAGRS
jgi:anti-sigma factor RsiW